MLIEEPSPVECVAQRIQKNDDPNKPNKSETAATTFIVTHVTPPNIFMNGQEMISQKHCESMETRQTNQRRMPLKLLNAALADAGP